ncbi:MAG: SMC family ATPase [Proteobacteria bacterium]|nr:SMC family ATPase [Pseudomonadota bacterium]MBU1688829.1 SMC family ATPase [Pseudomonadota bacterium]
MQILSITLKNIKSHRDKELHFVKGINVLSGVNGVGKSTIFEAIGYALFGVDARDFVGNIERFITIGAKKGEIAVTFTSDSAETYRVSRSVGAGSKWLLAREIDGDFEVEDHSGAPETENRIKELLGLDSGRPLADQFKLVIGPFQNEFLGPFVLKQPTRRQEAFDEILGIDAWRKTYKGTSTLLKAVQSKIEVLTVEIEGKQEQVDTLPERQKELATLTTENEGQEKDLTGKEKSLAETDKQLAGLDEQEKTTNVVKSEIQVLENRIRDGEGKITDQNKRVEEAELALATIDKSKAGKEAFEGAEASLKALREQEKLQREIEKDITSLDKESTRLTQTLEHELREIEKTEKQLSEEESQLQKDRKALTADDNLSKTASRLLELRKEAEEIRKGQGLLDGRRAGLMEGKEKLAEGVCPFFKEECRNIEGIAPRDVFTARVDDLDKEILELEKRLAGLGQKIAEAEQAQHELDSLKVRTQELEKQLTGLTRRRDENNNRKRPLDGMKKQQAEAEQKALTRKEELKKFSKLETEIAKVEKLRIEHQAARDTFFANQKDALDLDNRRATLKEWTRLLEEIKTELAAKQKVLVKLDKDYDLKRHAEVRLAKEQLLAVVATIKQKIADLGKNRLRLEEEIKRLNKIQEEIKGKLAEKKILAGKAELVTFLRSKIFNNVSAQLSERFREEISLRADRIYRNIAETDEELHWGDKYQIVLRDMQDGTIRERSDDQLSGGQTMSAVVALRLALLQTIGARIAFFDEPTSNLDAARRENLAHAFRAIDVGREEVTEHWYDQLFLISHDIAFTEVTDQIISLES